MASIVRRGKTFSVVHYEGTGKDRHQVWDSGLSYTAAKALKAKLEHEGVVKVKAKGDDMTVSEFLYEFVEKYGAKRWVASAYDGNVGLLENYVHPYLGDKKLKSIRTKTVDGTQGKGAKSAGARAGFEGSRLHLPQGVLRLLPYALCDSSCDCLHDARRRDWCLTMGSC